MLHPMYEISILTTTICKPNPEKGSRDYNFLNPDPESRD